MLEALSVQTNASPKEFITQNVLKSPDTLYLREHRRSRFLHAVIQRAISYITITEVVVLQKTTNGRCNN
jgi:hypothetical protein